MPRAAPSTCRASSDPPLRLVKLFVETLCGPCGRRENLSEPELRADHVEHIGASFSVLVRCAHHTRA
jgi:hypothetical protein